MTSIYYDTAEPISLSPGIFGDSAYSGATLYVAVGGLEKAKSTTPWMYFKNICENDFGGIDDIRVDADSDAPIKVYNLNGVRIADSTDNLPTGLYIVRQGKLIRKVAVK